IVPYQNRESCPFTLLKENQLYWFSHIVSGYDEDLVLHPGTVFHESRDQAQNLLCDGDVLLHGKREGNVMVVVDVYLRHAGHMQSMSSESKLLSIQQAITTQLFRREHRYSQNIPVQLRLPGIALFTELQMYTSYWIRRTNVFLDKNTYNQRW